MAGDASGNGYATSEADVYQYPSVNSFNPLGQNGTYTTALYGSQLISTGQFAPQSSVEVESNIQLVSPDDSSSASVTGVTEIFMSSSVPEPTSGVPFGIGLTAIAGYALYQHWKVSRGRPYFSHSEVNPTFLPPGVK